MFTYQVRHRVFRTKEGTALAFPATGEVRFEFRPKQPFGESPTGGHTVVAGQSGSLLFNTYTGSFTVHAKTSLSPLNVEITDESGTVKLTGTKLVVNQEFQSMEQLARVVEACYFFLPPLLNVEFADPPYVTSITGAIGGVEFTWDLLRWSIPITVTTQQNQEHIASLALKRLQLATAPQRRRLLASLHYFHVACRLSRVSCTPGEFVAEAVLNLAKCLESLFPANDGIQSIDAIRLGLRSLEISDTQIERDFVPAVVLRNKIDVAHVELGVFTIDELTTIHRYTEHAENAFQGMFKKLIALLETGTFEIVPYDISEPRKEAVAIIERMKELGIPLHTN